MINVTKNYNLMVNFSSGKFTCNEKIIFVEKDNKSSKFIITFEEDINDKYVCLKMKHYCGIVKETAILVKDNMIEIVLTNDILIAGKMKMSISLIGSDNEILTNVEYLDNIEIKDSLGDGDELSEEEIGIVENMLSDLTKYYNEAKEEMNDIKEASIVDIENAKEDAIQEISASKEELQTQIDALVEENTKYKAQIPTGHKKANSVQLTDSAEGLAIENVALWGATEQAQYEGYNLLDLATLNGKIVNGITVVKNVDGSLTFNGTSTQGFAIYHHTINLTLPAGNYINSIGRTIVSGVYISLDSIDNTMISGNSISQKSFTLTQEKTYSLYYIWINNGVTLKNFTIYPMVYSGTTTKDYEPYCGGQASPNPDYPQTIHKVTGNCNVKMHSRNFFDKNTTFTTGKTLDVTTGEVIAGSLDSLGVSDYVEIFKTKNAVLSGKLVPVGWSTKICAYDKNKNFVYGTTIAYSSSNTVFQITSENEFCYIRFVKNSPEYKADTVQLEIGTTKTSYKPYAEENLYNKSNNTTGKYLTQGGTPSSISGWNTSDYIALETTKKYKYSGLTNVGIAPYSCYYDANKQFISSFKQATGTNYLTVPANAVYVRFSIIDADINTFSLIIDQSTPLTLGNIELYDGDKIQISYTEKAGYKTVTGANVVNNMAKYTFTGNENYTKSPLSDENWFCGYILNDMIFNIIMHSTIMKASRFSRIGQYTTITDSECIGCTRQFHVRVNAQDLVENSAEAWKNLLKTWYDAGEPLYVVYPLETPTTTPITDTTLLSQLETLINMETYKEITNIETEGADLNPVIEFDYSKDLTTIINNLTQAIIEIGGE